MASMLEQNPVEIVLLKPCILNLIDTWLAGEFITVFENNAGLTDLGPFRKASLSNSLIDQTEPIVEPKDTPNSSVSASSNGYFIPASSIASWEAQSVNLVVLSKLRNPFCPNMSSALKSLISPPNFVRHVLISNNVIGFIPDRPSLSPAQNSFLPIPVEASTPNPVITMRLSIAIRLRGYLLPLFSLSSCAAIHLSMVDFLNRQLAPTLKHGSLPAFACL